MARGDKVTRPRILETDPIYGNHKREKVIAGGFTLMARTCRRRSETRVDEWGKPVYEEWEQRQYMPNDMVEKKKVRGWYLIDQQEAAAVAVEKDAQAAAKDTAPAQQEAPPQKRGPGRPRKG